LDSTIAAGGQFVLRRVEAGEPAFIEMWNQMGGMTRYDARRTYWSNNRQTFAKALNT